MTGPSRGAGQAPVRFDDMLGALRAYADEHGHARPPQKYRSPEGQPVGKWKEKLRRHYSEGRLGQREIGELERLPGWRWQEEPDDRWETGLERLRAFAEESGHANITRWYQCPDGYALGRWVTNQRQRRDRMPPDRRRALEAVPGWRWTAADARLDRVLAEVARYHAEHGAVPMPRDYRPGHDPELALGDWMTEQVSDYNSGRIDPDLAFRLEMIPGFVWGQRDAAFRDLYRRLARYAAAYGAADPPAAYCGDDGFPLGRRAGWLRKEYRNGNLSADRIESLERLRGWTWDSARPGRLGPDQESFDVALRRLREYAVGHDIGVIPPGIRIRDGRSLRTWTHNLRNAYRNGRLAADRITALEAVPGWSWTPRDDADEHRRDQWMACLRAYAAEHGTARVPYGYVTSDGAGLGAWVYRQRVKKRDGTLLAEHAAALESLPGWSWDSGYAPRRPRGLPKTAASSRTRPESDGRRECPECGRRFWDLDQHVMLTHERLSGGRLSRPCWEGIPATSLERRPVRMKAGRVKVSPATADHPVCFRRTADERKPYVSECSAEVWVDRENDAIRIPYGSHWGRVPGILHKFSGGGIDGRYGWFTSGQCGSGWDTSGVPRTLRARHAGTWQNSPPESGTTTASVAFKPRSDRAPPMEGDGSPQWLLITTARARLTTT